MRRRILLMRMMPFLCDVVDDGLVVDFLNIPEGVTVTVPNMIAIPEVDGE